MKLVKTETAKLGAEGGKWLKELIDDAIEKDRDYFKMMGSLRNLLSGEHWKNVKGVSKEQIKLVVNLAHSHVRSLVPTLFFQNPSLDCVPTAPQHAGKEETWNNIVNHTLDKIKFATEFKKVVLDAVLYPEGVMKDVMKKPEASTSEENSSGPTVWLTKGSPVHVRISPLQLIVDRLSKDRDLENARFCAVRYRRPFAEIKNHPIYGPNVESDFKQVTGDNPTTGNAVHRVVSDTDKWDDEDSIHGTGVDENLVTIYEVWIHQLISVNNKFQVYQKMCVLLEDQEKPIRELESWETVMGTGFTRYPITRLVLVPIPDKLPQSELGVWQQMQMAINWLISRITELVENDRLLYAADPNKIKNFRKFKQAFYKGRSRELVEVEGIDAINLIQPSFVGRDNYQLVTILNQYIQQVAGLGQNRRGGSGIRTATEASLIDQGTRLKTDEKVDTVAKCLIEILEKHIMITRSLVSTDTGTGWVFAIGGDIGAVKWVNFTSEDIDWLPEVRLRVNSFRKMDSMEELQKYGGLLQSAIAMFQLYGPQIRVDLLYGRMLQAAGIYDAGKIVGNQDTQAMLQTIELAGIMAGVPTPVLEVHNHPVHMQVIEAFRQSEYGQKLIAMSPELADRLAQHEQEHIMKLQELQVKADKVNAMQNPFAAAGMSDTPTPQSAANEETSGDRMSTAAAGGNGELA